jgi:FixJ family two-component response regulator
VKTTCAVVSVVDDDESVRESLPDLLRELGYGVQVYASAEEFLVAESMLQTQCLILDIFMQGMSGPELVRELAIRNLRDHRPTPLGFSSWTMTSRYASRSNC